jgi:hypothetical protein
MNNLDLTKFLETILTSLKQPFLSLSDNIIVGFFISLIVVLTAFAFVGLMRVRWFYKREQKQLYQLEKVLETLESEQQPLKTIDELRNHHFFPIFHRNYRTLVYERIEFVLKLAANNKLGRLQTTAEKMPPKKLARQQSYFANFVISVLLIIGLAGTLWAFTDILANSQLSRAIEENEIKLEQYTPAISSIYGGLKSAMLASLAGILGTVLLLYVKLNWVQPVQERFFSHLDWITEIYLIPICGQFEKREQLEQSLLQVTHKLTQTVSQTHFLVQKLSAFMEKAGEIVEQFEQITNQNSPFYQASTQLFNAVETMGGNYAKLTQHINKLVTEHNNSLSQYKAHITNLEKTQKYFVRSQQLLVEDISKIPTEFQEVIDGHANTLQANKRYLDKLGELTKSLEFQQTNYSDHVTNATESMTASLAGLNEATSQLESFTTAFNKQAQLLIPELAKLGMEPLLRQYVEQLKNHLIETQNEFLASIKQQQETMQNEFNQNDAIRQIEQSVKEMHQLQLVKEKRSWFSSFFKRG